MKYIQNRKNKIILSLGLMTTIGLFSFQNCSSSLSLLSRGIQPKAKEDFSEMLTQSETEIRDTKNIMTEQNMFTDDKSRYRKTASDNTEATTTAEDPKSEMKLKLKRKKVRK